MESKESNNYIVYKHTSPSNKVYIGITSKSPQERWSSGFGYATQTYFFRAIVKYGWVNFKHEILFDGLTKDEAYAKEIELIAHYKSADIHYGYNIDLGGNNHIVSEETVKRMAKAKLGKHWSEARRLAYLKYKDTKPGRPVYKYDLEGTLLQTFSSVPKAANDAKVPVETLRTWLCTHRTPQRLGCCYSYGEFNQKFFGPKKYNTKPVLMYNLSGNFIREYTSIAEAGRDLHISTSHIPSVCRGVREQAGGYKWKYKDED